MSRTEVRQVECPSCGARPGQRCWRLRRSGVRRPGVANHMERVQAAYRALPER